MEKAEIDKANLHHTKDISKMSAVKDIIGDGSKPLAEFDEDLFEAMVAKVVIRGKSEFDFYFENGQIIKIKPEYALSQI